MKFKRFFIFFIVTLSFLCINTFFTFATENELFVPDEPGIYYSDEAYHYFTDSGAIMQVPEPGFYEVDNKTYYFYEDSSVHYVAASGIDTVSDKTYYFGDDSSVLTVSEPGFYEVEELYYYFQEDSSIYVPGEGKFEIDGKYYYFYEDGEIFVDGWMDDDDWEGYFTKSGGMIGKVTLEDRIYYFDHTANLITSSTAKRELVRKDDGTPMEIRTIAKQSVGGYDTLQGGCTDGTYGYYVLYNRNVEKCKIAKIRLSDGKLIKVSKILNIGHGNGMTYNPKENYLVVVHMTTYGKRLSLIDCDTLKRIRNVNVKIPSKLEGATASNVKNIKKFGGISYNAEKDVYVVLLSTSHNLMILNSQFKPLSYIKLSNKPKYVYQSINVTDDYILIGMSTARSDQPYNIICVYEWDGTYRFMINAKKGYELECVYNIGTDLYAGFYRTYWQSYYRTEKQIVKEKGKKKIKTVKIKDSRLIRSNYVYQISNYLWEI